MQISTWAFDAFLEPVEDGPQVQVVGFDVAEVPFHVFEVLVGGHHGGRVEFGTARGRGVRSTQDPSRAASASIWSCLRATARLSSVMVTSEVLAGSCTC